MFDMLGDNFLDFVGQRAKKTNDFNICGPVFGL